MSIGEREGALAGGGGVADAASLLLPSNRAVAPSSCPSSASTPVSSRLALLASSISRLILSISSISLCSHVFPSFPSPSPLSSARAPSPASLLSPPHLDGSALNILLTASGLILKYSAILPALHRVGSLAFKARRPFWVSRLRIFKGRQDVVPSGEFENLERRAERWVAQLGGVACSGSTSPSVVVEGGADTRMPPFASDFGPNGLRDCPGPKRSSRMLVALALALSPLAPSSSSTLGGLTLLKTSPTSSATLLLIAPPLFSLTVTIITQSHQLVLPARARAWIETQGSR